VDINAILISWEGRPATLNFLTDITKRKRAEDTIKENERQLWNERQQFTRKLIQVQEDERKRIARELHDDAAQNLALILLEIDGLWRNSEKLPEQVVDSLNRIRDDINRTQQDIRRYSHELRPGVLDYLGLESALEGLVEDMNSRNAIKASLKIEGKEERLADDMELALFRIAQEAVQNAYKHAGARNVHVALNLEKNRLLLTIRDDGAGFPQKPVVFEGMGLHSMNYRANAIGARLEIESSPGQGTKIVCKMFFPKS
jgi:signal transduction histidine kinase